MSHKGETLAGLIPYTRVWGHQNPLATVQAADGHKRTRNSRNSCDSSDNTGRNIRMTRETASYGADTGNSLSPVVDHDRRVLVAVRFPTSIAEISR